MAKGMRLPEKLEELQATLDLKKSKILNTSGPVHLVISHQSKQKRIKDQKKATNGGTFMAGMQESLIHSHLGR